MPTKAYKTMPNFITVTVAIAEKQAIILFAVMKRKPGWYSTERLRNFGKAVIVIGCLTGFLYQTTEFFQLYLEYPTVVDIQVTAPPLIDMPSITICNTLGYKLREFCEYFKQRTFSCITAELQKVADICEQFPLYCRDGKIDENIQLMTMTRFSQEVVFDQTDIHAMKLDLDQYLTCYIEYAGEKEKCDFNVILGSLYSENSLPSICYSLYNHWGQPNKERLQIPRGAVIKFNFQLNATFGGPNDEPEVPTMSIPAAPLVQIGFHSPYSLPSPFIYGSAFIGGEKYEVSLKQQEKHLLPAPYRTNCTDYRKAWIDNGGKNPSNQMSTFHKCKMEANLRQYGCIPASIDYPHEYKICPRCGSYTRNQSHCIGNLVDDCATYIQNFNQPCEDVTYDIMVKKKLITVSRAMTFPLLPEPEFVSVQIPAHICTDEKTWKTECSIVEIDVVFEDFEISNLTYVPKYVIIELFSVIGGYMGMWLGVSFIAIYDFVEVLSRKLYTSLNKKKKDSWSVPIIKQKEKNSG